MKKKFTELSEEEKKNIPLYSIGIVAELIGTSDQTIRIYEKHGLIKPARRNKNRFYSENDIKWLRCLRDLIRNRKFGIEGVKKLLNYAPCWEVTNCMDRKRGRCFAYRDRTKPCWELNMAVCRKESPTKCEDCIVFLSRTVKQKTT